MTAMINTIFTDIVAAMTTAGMAPIIGPKYGMTFVIPIIAPKKKRIFHSGYPEEQRGNQADHDTDDDLSADIAAKRCIDITNECPSLIAPFFGVIYHAIFLKR